MQCASITLSITPSLWVLFYKVLKHNCKNESNQSKFLQDNGWIFFPVNSNPRSTFNLRKLYISNATIEPMDIANWEYASQKPPIVNTRYFKKKCTTRKWTLWIISSKKPPTVKKNALNRLKMKYMKPNLRFENRDGRWNLSHSLAKPPTITAGLSGSSTLGSALSVFAKTGAQLCCEPASVSTNILYTFMLQQGLGTISQILKKKFNQNSPHLPVI